MNAKPAVAIAMSGGVDSSVGAALLLQAGHRVVGLTGKLWDAEDEGHAHKTCCTAVMARDAGRVCQLLGIPHYTLDLRDEFRREVVDQFEAEYLKGSTPNPCVSCNSMVKWGKLWEKAKSLGFERLATGHYARIKVDEHDDPHLHRGVDNEKDQSYFLWQIPRKLLKVTLFPLGDYTKPEIRQIATDLDLPVADKAESQEVCFIPNDDYRSWLQNRGGLLAAGSLAGDMVDEDGNVLGAHDGYPLFTIGQRRGLGLGGGGTRLFVTHIDPRTRRVQLGGEQQLHRSSFAVGNLNLLQPEAMTTVESLSVKIRYRDPGVPAKLSSIGDSVLTVVPDVPVKAVTPGQSAVFYRGDEVVAGGIIQPYPS